ncbi:MAG: hypothetical protein JKY48_08180 [Flavobacteriales bacterium]|nr:hypothetical protein [Flavobacteriales bacterium]
MRVLIVGLLLVGFSHLRGIGQERIHHRKFKKQMSTLYSSGVKHARIYDFNVSKFKHYSSEMAIIVDTGAINLYSHNRPQSKINMVNSISTIPINYDIVVYVVQKKGTSDYYGIYNIKQFKKYFLPMIKDQEKLIEEILSIRKIDWLKNLAFFVSEYNSKIRNSRIRNYLIRN